MYGNPFPVMRAFGLARQKKVPVVGFFFELFIPQLFFLPSSMWIFARSDDGGLPPVDKVS